MEWVTGNKFKDLAKWIYAPDRGVNLDIYGEINNLSTTDYRYLKNTLKLEELSDGDIIYTHTFYVDQLFHELQNTEKRVTVITHNCDINVSDYKIPENVIRWYSQNVNMVDSKLESIPIGLENDRWFPEINKKGKMLDKLSQERDLRNLVYMNHNVKTYPEERGLLYKLFSSISWVTSEKGVNGIGFDEYLDNIYNHAFVICPRGNGIDTHRTWECLYMGTIPIEILNHNNRFYSDLPILFVDDWSELSRDMLIDEYQRIRKAEWNMDKLKFSFWKNRICGI